MDADNVLFVKRGKVIQLASAREIVPGDLVCVYTEKDSHQWEVARVEQTDRKERFCKLVTDRGIRHVLRNEALRYRLGCKVPCMRSYPVSNWHPLSFGALDAEDFVQLYEGDWTDGSALAQIDSFLHKGHRQIDWLRVLPREGRGVSVPTKFLEDRGARARVLAVHDLPGLRTVYNVSSATNSPFASGIGLLTDL